MKTVSASMGAHLGQEVTTLATCWRVTRADGAVFGFTDHDRDLVVDGVTYRAASGYSRTAIASDASLGVDNLDIEGLLDSDALTGRDLRGGLFDHAEVRIFLVNWADPAQGVIQLRRGHLGEVTLKDGVFTAELRGLTQALSRQLLEATTPNCRNELGDGHCGVDLPAWTETATVADLVEPRRVFTITGGLTRTYLGGLARFTSGANAGLAMEVKAHDGATVELYLPLPGEIVAGDTLTLTAGCFKTPDACRAFGPTQIHRFRGEAHIPGVDRMLQYPTAKV